MKNLRLFWFALKKAPQETVTEKGRTESIELFPNFMTHFKSIDEEISRLTKSAHHSGAIQGILYLNCVCGRSLLS